MKIYERQFYRIPDPDDAALIGTGNVMETDPHQWAMSDVNQATPAFRVAGDFTDLFPDGTTIIVSGSTGNDGVYIVDGDAVYDVPNTVITVVGDELPDDTVDGVITRDVQQYKFTLKRDITAATFMIPFVNEAAITKLVVRRSFPADLAPATNFTVDLLNRSLTEAQFATSLGNISRVVPQQTATIDNAVSLLSDDGYSFINMEGNPTIQVRQIYLRLAVTGDVPTADSTWDVSVAGILTSLGC